MKIIIALVAAIAFMLAMLYPPFIVDRGTSGTVFAGFGYIADSAASPYPTATISPAVVNVPLLIAEFIFIGLFASCLWIVADQVSRMESARIRVVRNTALVACALFAACCVLVFIGSHRREVVQPDQQATPAQQEPKKNPYEQFIRPPAQK